MGWLKKSAAKMNLPEVNSAVTRLFSPPLLDSGSPAGMTNREERPFSSLWLISKSLSGIATNSPSSTSAFPHEVGGESEPFADIPTLYRISPSVMLELDPHIQNIFSMSDE